MKFEINTVADMQAVIKNRRDLEQALRFFRLQPGRCGVLFPTIDQMKLVKVALFGYHYEVGLRGQQWLTVDMSWTDIYPEPRKLIRRKRVR